MTAESWFATYDQVAQELSEKGYGGKEVEVAYLRGLIPQVARQLELEFDEATFEPLLETIPIIPDPINRNPDYTLLDVGRPMLELVSVTNGSNALTLDTDVQLWSRRPNSPGHKLRALTDAGRFMRGNAGLTDRLQPYEVSVTAWFGWRMRWDTEGWRTVDTLKAALDSSTTTVQVNTAAGTLGIDGITALYAPGALIRIVNQGTTDQYELMRIQSVDTSDPPVLTVTREERGSSAAAHDLDADVMVWSVQPEIIRAMQRWTVNWFTRRGVFNEGTITDIGFLRQAQDVPADVINLVRRMML